MAALTPSLSRKLANASALAAIGVVAIHLPPPADPLSAWGRLHALVPMGLCKAAVPFFMAVSGFFLARHVGEPGWWGRETRKRVRSLLVPYLLWSLLFAAWLLAGKTLPELVRGRSFDVVAWLAGKRGTLLGLDVTDTPLLVPLWYLRTLMLLVLASPAVSWFVRKGGRTALALLFAAYAAYAVVADLRPAWVTGSAVLSAVRQTFHPESLFYFAAGMGLALRVPPTGWLGRRTGAGLLALAVALLAVRTFGGVPVPYPAVIPCVLLGLWPFMPAVALPRAFVAGAFPLYLMHYFVCHSAARSPAVADGSLPAVAAVFLAAVLLPLAAAEVLRRLAPRLADRLFGGRA